MFGEIISPFHGDLLLEVLLRSLIFKMEFVSLKFCGSSSSIYMQNVGSLNA
jgi:hypothetical protein